MNARDEEELKELQDPEKWEEFPDGGVRGPAKSSRAVVSVAFSREDFRRIAEHAKRQGMKTSEFIRNATLERLAPDQRAQVEVKAPEPPVRSTA